RIREDDAPLDHGGGFPAPSGVASFWRGKKLGPPRRGAGLRGRLSELPALPAPFWLWQRPVWGPGAEDLDSGAGPEGRRSAGPAWAQGPRGPFGARDLGRRGAESRAGPGPRLWPARSSPGRAPFGARCPASRKSPVRAPPTPG